MVLAHQRNIGSVTLFALMLTSLMAMLMLSAMRLQTSHQQWLNFHRLSTDHQYLLIARFIEISQQLMAGKKFTCMNPPNVLSELLTNSKKTERYCGDITIVDIGSDSCQRIDQHHLARVYVVTVFDKKDQLAVWGVVTTTEAVVDQPCLGNLVYIKAGVQSMVVS